MQKENIILFEKFLQNEHAKHYTGTDDDMVDECEDWIACLDTEELIDYAQKFGDVRFKDGVESILSGNTMAARTFQRIKGAVNGDTNEPEIYAEQMDDDMDDDIDDDPNPEKI